MKRKNSNFLEFFSPRGVTGEQTVVALPHGWIVDLRLQDVPKPIWETVCGQQKPSLAPNFRWVYWIPRQAHHTLLAFLDSSSAPQWLYADIIAGAGVDPDGFPWTDDLYLDVIALCEVQPDGHWRVTDTEIIDQHELEEALGQGKVTQAQYNLAWAEARAVEAALRAGTFEAAATVRQYLTDPYT